MTFHFFLVIMEQENNFLEDIMNEQTQTTQTTAKSTHSAQSLVTIALMAAVLCVSAYISIPLPNGSHITALNFIVMLVALVFSIRESFLINLIWFLLGLLGLPVLIGGASGIGYVLGPWGGYSISFLIVAALVPLICTRKYNRILYTIIAILSAAFVDLFGSIWMMVVSDIALVPALVAGFLPFIVLDVVKAVIAAQIVPQIRKIVRQN